MNVYKTLVSLQWMPQWAESTGELERNPKGLNMATDLPCNT